VTPTESIAFATDGEVIFGGSAAAQVPGNDMICLPTLARGPTADMADAAGLPPYLLPNRRCQGSPSFTPLLPTPFRTDRLDVHVFHRVYPPCRFLKVRLTVPHQPRRSTLSSAAVGCMRGLASVVLERSDFITVDAVLAAASAQAHGPSGSKVLSQSTD